MKQRALLVSLVCSVFLIHATAALALGTTFTRDLTVGSSGPDVKALQVFLNNNGFTIASSGSGSKGHESTVFGVRTKIALTRFQEAHRAQILTPVGLTRGTGKFLAGTRAVVNAEIQGGSTGIVSPTSSIAPSITKVVTPTTVVTGTANLAVSAAPAPVAVAYINISNMTTRAGAPVQTNFSINPAKAQPTDLYWSTTNAGATRPGTVGGSTLYGTVSSTGLYTPPVNPRIGDRVYMVWAVSKSNAKVYDYAYVSITAPSTSAVITSITVSPSSTSLSTNAQMQFAAVVLGVGNYNSAVSWSASRGSITSSGLYTAPASGGADTVTARSTQDTGKVGTASISVNAPSTTAGVSSINISNMTTQAGTPAQTVVTINPTSAKATDLYWSTTVGGAAAPGVEGGSTLSGTVSASGLYTPPTNPIIGSRVYMVWAVSKTNAKVYDYGYVTITASTATPTPTPASTITSITVTPSSTTLNTNTQTQFAANVQGTGSYNPGVTWSASRGTITSSGLYTAPASGGADTITARSTQDTGKVGTASVSVNSDSVSISLGSLAAFPGCEGVGCVATGGRGGVVYTVNSLADTYKEGITHPTPYNGANGPTVTLRDALQASGPRTVVFSVSGTIELHGPIYPVQPNLTIAGQTSPGGIQVKAASDFVGTGGGSLMHSSDNTIVRYMRMRPGPSVTINASNGQGVDGLDGGNNYVLDHSSIEWSSNKPIAWGGATHNVTMSWNLMAEGTHTGVLFNGVTDNQAGLDTSSMDMHHNILDMFDHRLPYSNHKFMRMVNNLIFGYNYATLVRGNVHFDMIGNVYDGISSRVVPSSSKQEVRWADTFDHNEAQLVPGGDAAQFYMSNNFGPHNPTGLLDNFATMLRIASSENSQLNDSVVDSKYKASAPTSMPAALNYWPITVSRLNSYSDLKGILSSTVGAYQRLDATGAFVPNRDSLDTRILNYIANPSTSPSSLPGDFSPYGGAYPTLSGGAYPTSSLGDGIPDVWKTAHGLSTTASVANVVRPNAHGYTTLELYLSGLYPNGVALP